MHQPPEPGAVAPPFRARVDDGSLVALEQFRGVPVVLHFCGSWHPRCRADVAILVAASRRQAVGPFEVVDVLVADTVPEARRLYRGVEAGVLAIADPTAVISAAYGVRAVPQTFFIDPGGVVTSRVFGALVPAVLDAGLAGAAVGTSA